MWRRGLEAWVLDLSFVEVTKVEVTKAEAIKVELGVTKFILWRRCRAATEA